VKGDISFLSFQNGSSLRQRLEEGRRFRDDNRDRSEILAT